MRTTAYIIAFFILLFVIGMLGSCKKGNEIAPFQEGSYNGRNIVTVQGSTAWTLPISITFKSGHYKAGPLSLIDSGTYTLQGDTLIHFASVTPVFPNANSFIILSNDFHNQHQADSLILTKTIQTGISTDELRLKLQ